MVGQHDWPGKPIDTNRLFVVSLNNIGGCDGSTGPGSINPETGKPWGPDFPRIEVQDWVNTQKQLAERLGIQRWAAVVGGSLGGMQAMQWAIDYPDWVVHCWPQQPVLPLKILLSMKLHATPYSPTRRGTVVITDPTTVPRKVWHSREWSGISLHVSGWYERPLGRICGGARLPRKMTRSLR